MRFIPTDNNKNDIPYGENGYYCSTMTQAGEYCHDIGITLTA